MAKQAFISSPENTDNRAPAGRLVTEIYETIHIKVPCSAPGM